MERVRGSFPEWEQRQTTAYIPNRRSLDAALRPVATACTALLRAATASDLRMGPCRANGVGSTGDAHCRLSTCWQSSGACKTRGACMPHAACRLLHVATHVLLGAVRRQLQNLVERCVRRARGESLRCEQQYRPEQAGMHMICACLPNCACACGEMRACKGIGGLHWFEQEY